MKAKPRGLEDRIRVSVGTEILFISRDDRKWQAYGSMLPGASEWRQIEDRKLDEAVLDLGAMEEALHEVVHRVQTPLPKGADALERLRMAHRERTRGSSLRKIGALLRAAERSDGVEARPWAPSAVKAVLERGYIELED